MWHAMVEPLMRSTAPTSNANERRAFDKNLLHDQGVKRLYQRYLAGRSAYERNLFLESLHPAQQAKLRRRIELSG